MKRFNELIQERKFDEAVRSMQESFPDCDKSKYSEIAGRKKHTPEEISQLKQEDLIALVHVLVRALRWLEPPILSINGKLVENEEMHFPFEHETIAIYERGKELDLWE